MSILDNIKILYQEKDRVLGRVGEVRILIPPWIDSLTISMQDAKDALDSNVLIDRRGVEMLSYLFSGMINILESLKKAWDKHLPSLRIIFVDIFKFL